MKSKRKGLRVLLSLMLVLLLAAAVSGPALADTVHCIGNAHIDTAWKWPKSDTMEVVDDTYRSMINLMNSNADFRFSTSASIHYKWAKRYFPVLFQDVKAKIASGQWEITGGQVVEPDTNVTSGESHVRQFLYGKRYFKEEFGLDIRMGFLPDCFGFTWNWPQIMEKSGMDMWLTSKLNWNDTNDWPYDGPFLWQGADGTQFPTYKLTHDYVSSPSSGNLAATLTYPNSIGLTESMHLYGSGDHGGGPTQSNINTINSNSTAVMDTVVNYYDNYLANHLGALTVYEDELYLETHRGVYTSQAKTKKNNRTSEIKAEEAEKLSIIAKWLGEEVYPYGDITEMWDEIILVNQMHDILPGSSIAEVYDDADIEYATVYSTLNPIIDTAAAKIAGRMDTSGTGTPLVVLNPLSWTRTDLVEAEVTFASAPPSVRVYDSEVEIPSQVLSINGNTAKFIFVAEDVPGIGAKVFHVTSDTQGSYSTGLSIGSNVIENNLYQVTLSSSTGHITSLYDKTNTKEALSADANELHFFTDTPSTYDAWNLGPDVKNDNYTLISSLGSLTIEESGPIRAIYKVGKSYSGSTFYQYITLYSNVDRVDVKMHVDWNENRKLLKVSFPFNVSTSASNTTATYEIPYAAITRPIKRNTSYEQARFEVSGHKWADLSDSSTSYGVSILNDCKYGWDALDNRLRLTLLKSATDPDPNADDGPHDITYSIYPHSGDWKSANTVQKGHELNYPLIPVVATSHTGSLGSSFSFASTNKDNIVISAIKRAEDDGAIIMRLYETEGASSTPVTVTLAGNINNAYEMDMIEWENIGSVSYTANQFDLTMGNYDIRTVRLELATPYDSTLPSVQSASSDALTRVRVLFSEEVEKVSAETTANYSISGGISVSGAELQDELNEVVLTTSQMTSEATYTLTVSGVKDGASPANTMTSQNKDFVALPEISNLALNKTVEASDYSSGYEPQKAVDGAVENNSKWYATGGEPYWLKVDLGADATYQISKFIIKHACAGHEDFEFNTKTFQIQRGDSWTGPWTDLVSVNFNKLPVSEHPIALTEIRYVRLYITDATRSSNTAARIYEFEVWGYPGADTTPPTISEVSCDDPTKVKVQYSEPVEEASATNVSNYSIDNGITISSAAMDGTSAVILTTSEHSGGITYTLTVNNVKDVASNTIAANTQATYELITWQIEDFETGFGDWTNPTVDDDDWYRNQGSTPSSSTGPDHDNTIGATGWYIHMETSSGYANTAGDEVHLEGPDLDATTWDITLSFYYHMYGSDIGTLNVDVYDGSWNNGVWSLSGQQHSSSAAAYTQASVDLSAYSGTIKIRFRGVAAGGYRGDIAIDDIKITKTQTGGDTTPPTINEVTCTESTKVKVQYSEAVEETSATNVSNYSIDNGITISSAAMDGTSAVILTTSEHSGSITYTLTVNNVKDTAENTIAPNTQATYSYVSSLSHTYNFEGITQSNTDYNAYACDVDKFPFAGKSSNRNSQVEATDTQYVNISADNTAEWATADPGPGDKIFLWVEMKIEETPGDITQIDLTFNGNTDGSGATTHKIYVMKAGADWTQSASWVQLGTSLDIEPDVDTEMTRSITSNITDYIDASGNIVWGVYETRSSEDMRINYLELVVNSQ